MGSLLTDDSSYLHREDFELEEEDEDEKKEFWRRTHIECDFCGDFLLFDDEQIQITIVQAQDLGGRIECYPMVDDEGDFSYEPVFLHFECWENMEEDMEELLRDNPPLRSDATHRDILKCKFCRAGIEAWEEFAYVAFGQLVLGKRNITTFKETDDSTPGSVCLNCMHRMNEEIGEVWHGG